MAIKENVFKMKEGDMIPCRYTSSSVGKEGVFSEFGTCNLDYITQYYTEKPNGKFNFIHSGIDEFGRIRLIADRNIQTHITCDALDIANGETEKSLSFSDSILKLPDPDILTTSSTRSLNFSPDGKYLVLTTMLSPYVAIYKIENDIITKLSNPTELPTGESYDVEFSPNGEFFVVTHNNFPYITIYKIENDIVTKLPNPTNLPSTNTYKLKFSSSGKYLAVTKNSNFLIYKIENDVFIKTIISTNVSTGLINNLCFSKDEKYFAIGNNLMTIYKIENDIFTKLSNPIDLPQSSAVDISFSPNCKFISTSFGDSPYVAIYKIENDIITKLPSPDILPTGYSVANLFSPDNKYLIVGNYNFPYITIYKIEGDVFSKLPAPKFAPENIDVRRLSFSPDGKYLSVGHNASPFITIYKIENDIFSKMPNAAVLPDNPIGGSIFSKDGKYLAVGQDELPYVSVYQIKNLNNIDSNTNVKTKLITSSEWDNIIVGSTLKGTTVAGNNTLWNWENMFSWTSTLGTLPAYRMIRGKEFANTTSSTISSTSSSTIGFRPMLLISEIKKYKFNMLRPYVEINPYPINSHNDNFDDSLPLYHVIVSQGSLKMYFLVILQDQSKNPDRIYETIRCEYISLHGLDERDIYLETVDNLAISADCTIVNEIFEWNLMPYGIKLLSANFHNFEFFESNKEGKGFIFEDPSLYNSLKDLINKKCITMMKNPKVIQH